MPEVFLGILPGWGGTQLLPRIAGPENAVTVIIENALNQNRMMKPKDALRLGVVDVVLDAADYLEQSLAWLAGVLDGSITVPRNEFAGATDEEWAAGAGARQDHRGHADPRRGAGAVPGAGDDRAVPDRRSGRRAGRRAARRWST